MCGKPNEDRFFGVERAVTPAQHQKNGFIIECDIVKVLRNSNEPK